MDDKDKLHGINYLTWCFLMQMILIHAELWDIVVNPPEGEYTAAQRKLTQKAFALIVFNLSTSLLPVVRVCANASEAWRKLETLYAGRSEARIQFLREQLSVLVMSDIRETVSEYFARARGIWNELVSLGHATTETDVVWSVLKGLPSRFTVIVTFLRNKNNLTIDSVMTRILNFDQATNVYAQPDSGAKSVSEGSAIAHVAAPVKTCHYCKKPGHLIKDCRKRIAKEASRNAPVAGVAIARVAEDFGY